MKKINGNVFEPIQTTVNTQTAANPSHAVFDEVGVNSSSSRPCSRIEEIPNYGGSVNTAGFYEEDDFLEEEDDNDDDDEWDG